MKNFHWIFSNFSTARLSSVLWRIFAHCLGPKTKSIQILFYWKCFIAENAASGVPGWAPAPALGWAQMFSKCIPLFLMIYRDTRENVYNETINGDRGEILQCRDVSTHGHNRNIIWLHWRTICNINVNSVDNNI